MWHLFRPFPPLREVALGVPDLVAAGVLVQRELIDQRAFSSAAKARGLKSFDPEKLEKWDEQGMVSPLCFVRGRWTHWHLSSPYPLDGIEFRDEVGFRPWAEYEFRPEDEREPEITALYSEWQLLYVGAAGDASQTIVPAEVLLEGGKRLVKWAESLRWFRPRGPLCVACGSLRRLRSTQGGDRAPYGLRTSRAGRERRRSCRDCVGARGQG